MKYDKKAIGKRIKEERIKANFKSQGDFAECMGYAYESRQTIANWEKGKTMPCFEDFFKMCEIFDCDYGYLMCEYDCKQRNRTDVQAVIGLSENAIKVLESINKSPYKEALESLSDIIEHKDFFKLLRSVHIHKFNFNRKMFKQFNTNIDSFADFFNCLPHEVSDYAKASSHSLIKNTIMKIVDDMK